LAKGDLRNIDQWIVLAQTAGFNAETFARLCGITTRQLRRHAQKAFGRSAQEWLNEQRLIAAGYRLKETGCVKTVSMELGFKHASHFSRQFKEHYGVPPSEFIRGSLKTSFLRGCGSEAQARSDSKI
jgi:AraC-like DNA-binding protein